MCPAAGEAIELYQALTSHGSAYQESKRRAATESTINRVRMLLAEAHTKKTETEADKNDHMDTDSSPLQPAHAHAQPAQVAAHMDIDSPLPPALAVGLASISAASNLPPAKVADPSDVASPTTGPLKRKNQEEAEEPTAEASALPASKKPRPDDPVNLADDDDDDSQPQPIFGQALNNFGLNAAKNKAAKNQKNKTSTTPMQQTRLTGTRSSNAKHKKDI